MVVLLPTIGECSYLPGMVGRQGKVTMAKRKSLKGLKDTVLEYVVLHFKEVIMANYPSLKHKDVPLPSHLPWKIAEKSLDMRWSIPYQFLDSGPFGPPSFDRSAIPFLKMTPEVGYVKGRFEVFPVALERFSDTLTVLDISVVVGHSFLTRVRCLTNLVQLSLGHSIVDGLTFEDIVETTKSLGKLRILDIGFLLRSNLAAISVKFADLIDIIDKVPTLEYLDISGSDFQWTTPTSLPDRKIYFLGSMFCELERHETAAYQLAHKVAGTSSWENLLNACETYIKRRFMFDTALSTAMKYRNHMSSEYSCRMEKVILDGIDHYLEDNYILEKLWDLLFHILHTRTFTSDFLAKATKMICSACERIKPSQKNASSFYIFELGREIINNHVLEEYVKGEIDKDPNGPLARKLSDHINRFS